MPGLCSDRSPVRTLTASKGQCQVGTQSPRSDCGSSLPVQPKAMPVGPRPPFSPAALSFLPVSVRSLATPTSRRPAVLALTRGPRLPSSAARHPAPSPLSSLPAVSVVYFCQPLSLFLPPAFLQCPHFPLSLAFVPRPRGSLQSPTAGAPLLPGPWCSALGLLSCSENRKGA